MADSKEIISLNFSDMNTRGILNPLVSFDCIFRDDAVIYDKHVKNTIELIKANNREISQEAK